MDTLFMVLLGFMVGAWVFTLLGVGYVMWRYVYVPWRVVRTDFAGVNTALSNINQRLENVERSSAQNRVWAMSDEELASYEQQIRALRQQRAVNR